MKRFSSLILLIFLAAPVAAHQVGADCTVKDDRIDVEAYFSDDTPVRQARVTVRDEGDKVVAEGRTDDKGKWQCRLLPAGLYRVGVDAGPGHKATVRLKVPEGKGAKPADLAALIARVKKIRAEGDGGADATDAFRELVRQGPTTLPVLLAALDDANPAASHYLRTAVDQIGEAALAKKTLPVKELEAFVRDTKHAARGRFLAYEWLCRADPAVPARVLGDLLDDPGLELRREAVAAVMKRAATEFNAKDEAKATASFRQALAAARDRDQVQAIATDLGKLGVKIDLSTQFGFVRDWLLIGPFDNPDDKGFAGALPPEKGIDLGAAYEGKGGGMLRWKVQRTADVFGAVDLNTALVKDKEVVAYALAVVMSEKERPIELRRQQQRRRDVPQRRQGVLAGVRPPGHAHGSARRPRHAQGGPQ